MNMADGFDLSHDDYKDFIKYCEGSKSGFGIIEHINDLIKKYVKDNSDFVTTLMEHIEIMYPKIENDYEDKDGYENEEAFYRQDILDLKTECKGIDRPGLKFLYSYLCSLSSDEKKFRRVSGLKEELLSINTDNSFNTDLDSDYLTTIFEFLNKEKFLEQRFQDAFIAIFTDQPLGEIKPRKWLIRSNKGADLIALFELIKHLCKWEYERVNLKENFFRKVVKCFKRFDETEITVKAVERSYHRWDRHNKTQEILDSKNYSDPRFVLVNYLSTLL
jgi:hypothetical protein